MGNVIVGFDVLGLAMRPLDGSLWGDEAIVEDDAGAAPGTPRFQVRGAHARDLPVAHEQNLAYAAAVQFLRLVRRQGGDPGPLAITLIKNLPIGSGLGSSASSAVATLVALNTHCGDPLTSAGTAGGWRAPRAGQRRGHYDNVAPALCGGVCLLGSPFDPYGRAADAAPSPEQERQARWRSAPRCLVQLPWPDELVLVFVTPEYRINTRDARAALPKQVPLAASAEATRRLALFVAALYHRDMDLLEESFHDDLVEPARAHLLPGFAEAKRVALEGGALGFSFSGSGPTTFALAPNLEAASAIGEVMRQAFAGAGLRSSVRLARVDDTGARALDPRD
jgi:homoserine kinase